MPKQFDRQSYYQRTGRMVAYLLGAIILTRLSAGYFSIALVLMGIAFASKKRYGESLTLFILFPFMIILNHSILPKPTITRFMLRFGPLLIGLTLAAVSAGRKGSHMIPLGTLIPYLVFEAVSSFYGYAPQVSYMKLVNFSFFLASIWLGTRNLHHHNHDVQVVRCAILAFSCILIFGSLSILPWPTVAYSTSYVGAEEYGVHFGLSTIAESREAYEISSGSRLALFSGITFHSQAMGPIAGCIFAWVLCDMAFLERRIRWLHALLLIGCMSIMYLTRSRCALVVAIVGMASVLFYAAQKVRFPLKLHRHILRLAVLICVFITVVLMIGQIRSGMISKWLRKTNNVVADERSQLEALTSSRQGLINEMKRDFRKSPWIGCGFQVDDHSAYFQKLLSQQGKFVLSVPIEKGLLPMMVLGEGGIIGSVIFAIFVVSFCTICSKKHFYVTVALFWALFAVNIGEATFFSPGGPGGIEWCLCILGGFTLDTILVYPTVWRNVRPDGTVEDYGDWN